LRATVAAGTSTTTRSPLSTGAAVAEQASRPASAPRDTNARTIATVSAITRQPAAITAGLPHTIDNSTSSTVADHRTVDQCFAYGVDHTQNGELYVPQYL
jgi:hypothetical protein